MKYYSGRILNINALLTLLLGLAGLVYLGINDLANWALVTTGAAILLLGFMVWKFENSRIDARMLILIATMSALAAVSRVLFAAIPSVQPATFIIMITGYVFGPVIGLAVGMLTAFVSNMFLGQGPWTLWQMLGWGLCGIAAGWLGKNNQFRLLPFLVLSGLAGLFFGLLMNSWHWLAFVYPLNVTTFLATWAASIVFDLMHAGGNIIFALILGRPFYNYLLRFRQRMFFQPVGGSTPGKPDS
ncbi:MAG: ECF transporter S component [Syntrophomonadaceae bacterium]|jgi:energy-coupling factor transport system substrate-specific component